MIVADEGRLVEIDPPGAPESMGTLEQILETLYPWARRVAFMLCRSAHDADDLVQDAFSAVIRRPPTPMTEDAVRAWLRTVLTRMHGRGLRSRAREARALLRLDLRRPIEVSEDTADLLTAMRALGARQRACVALYYLEDLPEAEIARTLGIAEGTVKAHLAQARDRLRRALHI